MPYGLPQPRRNKYARDYQEYEKERFGKRFWQKTRAQSHCHCQTRCAHNKKWSHEESQQTWRTSCVFVLNAI